MDWQLRRKWSRKRIIPSTLRDLHWHIYRHYQVQHADTDQAQHTAMSIYTPSAKTYADISAVNIQVRSADTNYSLSNQSPALTYLPPLFKFSMLTLIQAQHAATDIYQVLTLQPEVIEILQEQKRPQPRQMGTSQESTSPIKLSMLRKYKPISNEPRKT